MVYTYIWKVVNRNFQVYFVDIVQIVDIENVHNLYCTKLNNKKAKI